MSDISGIIDRLRDPNCRLLTLLGAGGIGKTRLVIEMIRHLTDSDFAHGVFYIPLAPLSSADAIAPAIANILGITAYNKASLEQQLIDFLSQRNVLLVLDNFEHVMGGVTLVDEIVSTAPDVTILATSREILNLNMEYIWHVRGMAYPSTSDPEDINRFDALNLFIERAIQVRRDFALGNEQLNIIRICQLVDGMPLGIELAAGWLKTLSPSEIVKKIDSGIDILATRARNIPERHRSIRAVFDHSWELLSADEQAVFPRLSVFRGGFSLEAAEQVANADLLTLSGLVEKSMVRRDANGRYDVHELMRQYAENVLRQVDEFEATNTTHMTYFAAFTSERTEDLKGKRQVDAHNELMNDYPNVIKAWDYGVKRSEYDVVGAMLEALNANNFIGSDRYSLLLLLDSAHLKMPNPTTREHRITANRLIAWKIYWIGAVKYTRLIHGGIETVLNMSGLEWVDHCIREAKENNDLIVQLLCHISKGDHIQRATGLPKDYVLGLELSQRTQDRWYECMCLESIVKHYFMTKRVKDSEGDTFLERYLEVALAIGNPSKIASAHGYRAVAALDRGDVLEAKKSNKLVIDYWRQIGNKSELASNEIKLGACYVSLGDFSQARKHIEIGIQLTEETQNYHHWGYMLLVKIEAVAGNSQATSRYLQMLNFDDLGGVFQYECLSLYQLEMGSVDDARQSIMRVLSEGLIYVGTRPMIDLIPHVSFVMVHDNNYEDAVELLGLTDNHPSGATDWMANWNKLTQLRADLKTELGEEAYQEAWERGTQRNLEDTIAELLSYLSDEESPKAKLKSQPLIEPLTKRELEVLALLGEGLSNPKIANQLTVSIGTIKKHVHNISQKLDATNRTQAVLEAKKLGLL